MVATAVHSAIALPAARLRPWLVAGARRILPVAPADLAVRLAWTARR